MPVYDLRKYPDPILHKKACKLENIVPGDRKILAQMTETMYFMSGMGLAGPQVGIGKQLVVADVGDGLVKLVNPEIISKEGESLMEEGCLSIPGVFLDVRRAEKITVEGWDENQKKIQLTAEGLLARVLQHEIDHLQGILIIDKREKKEDRDLLGKT